MKRCSRCGKLIPSEVAFCPYCGVRAKSSPWPWIIGATSLIAIALIVFLLVRADLPTWIVEAVDGTDRESGGEYLLLPSEVDALELPTPVWTENFSTISPPPATTPLVASATPIPPEATLDPHISALEMGSTRSREKDGMTQVYVPAGDYAMGSEKGNSDERPVHTVRLDAFWIDQTEVTNGMFAIFARQTGYLTDAEKRGSSWVYSGGGWPEQSGASWKNPDGLQSSVSGKDDFPVIHVSWNDAQAYCDWVGGRLPTEAEWEKAAGGGWRQTYPWGNSDPTKSLANFNMAYGWLTPVGSIPAGASPYGALDMAGNVWEWVDDWYEADYYSKSLDENPAGPASGVKKVQRGGSWPDEAWGIRLTDRYYMVPDGSVSSGGFRCANSANQP